MSEHLTSSVAAKLIQHTLSLAEQRERFAHWRNCAQCRTILERLQEAAGFGPRELAPGVDLGYLQIKEPQPMTLLYTDNALLRLQLGSDALPSPRGLSLPSSRLLPIPAEHTGHAWAAELGDYFGSGKPFSIPLIHSGLIDSDFVRQVLFWTSLIPFGETCSYGELAGWLGKPAAARAVGGALHRNPLPLAIPCHRVIGADGSLTGFGGGLALKRKMLELEGSLVQIRR